MTYPIQANFSRGELSPRLYARVDLEYYKAALKRATNWTALRHGGMRKRSGFRFVKEVKDSTKKVRLIPFVFSNDQAYALSFGDQYARMFTNGGIITTGGGTPTAITKANPGVVTLNAHGFSNGERAYATGIGGMTELNNREFVVTVVDPNNFSIGVNTTGYGTFTSGGLFKKIVEIATPYLETELADIDFAQSADIIGLTHGSYAPREITRTSDTNWTISTATFYDGPFLDEAVNNANGVKPSARNMPTGTKSDTTLMDGNENTQVETIADSWTVSLTAIAGGAVCDHYYIQGGSKPDWTPGAWTFEGYDGTNWIVLDRRVGQSFAPGEKKFYEFQNDQSFTGYRLIFTANNGFVDGSNNTRYKLAEIGIGYNGDYAPTMTLTFDNTTNINGGAGFQTDDVGRHIRILSSDGRWRWFIITARTSTTVVVGRLYGHALPDTDKIFRWKLGSWKAGQWPRLIGFYQSRRAFAASAAEPNVAWLTKTGDFYDHGVSQPLLEDDALRFRLLSGKIDSIKWLAELEKMAIGTAGNVRVLGKANGNQGFGATNFEQNVQVFSGSKKVKPVQIGSVLVYADRFGKILREFVYDINQDGYAAPDLSILSDHLLKAGIVEMAYQESPDSTVWIVLADGSMVAMTYEREQKIVALTPITVAPGDPGTSAYVESVCTIPGATRDEVWIAVRRTIGGVTRRFVETLAPEFENAALEDAVFLDSAVTYSGAATGTVTGINHLAGLVVDVLADGKVVRGLTVSASGSITLPGGLTASKIHVGLRYTATGQTLALNEVGQQDGVAISRRKILNDVVFAVTDSLGLKAKGVTSIDAYDVFLRQDSDPADRMNLRSGKYLFKFDNSWRDDGEFIFYSDDPLPCTINGIIFNVEGEP